MLQLANRTPYAFRLSVLPDQRGVESAVIMVQGTFRLGSGMVAEQQAPLHLVDVWAGEPGVSPLREASDVALAKPATDVLLTGVARPPGGTSSPSFQVAFAIGPVRKQIAVCGPRMWHRGWFGERATAPSPVAEVPLQWSAAEVGALPPQLMHPQRPVVRRRGAPAAWGGCGPIPPTWAPRVGHAGTYDQAWQRTRAPWLPNDFDARFFQLAPPDQIAPGHLVGGEPITLHGCHPAGDFTGAIPRRHLTLVCDISGSISRPPLALDTIRLLPELDEVRLVWRSVLPLGAQVLRLRQVELGEVA